MTRQWGPPDDRARGMTLVELLVVVAIIGLLVALLLPAVQSVRESARRNYCMNNLKQIGAAATQHLAQHGHFPTGGWGWGWLGDPDRGFRHRQPGSWVFSCLPFLEQVPLYSLQAGTDGSTTPTRADAGAKVLATALPVFQCPSRREVRPYPHWRSSTGYLTAFGNTSNTSAVAKSDYAANGGDRNFYPSAGGLWASHCGNADCGPASLPADADLETFVAQSNNNPSTQPTGVVFVMSAIVPGSIRDGLSNTFFGGEKSLYPESYTTGASAGDNENMYVGINAESVRCANSGTPARQDTSGIDYVNNFGSAHAGQFGAVRCDGSVQMISYDINGTTYGRLANRRDGQAIDESGL